MSLSVFNNTMQRFDLEAARQMLESGAGLSWFGDQLLIFWGISHTGPIPTEPVALYCPEFFAEEATWKSYEHFSLVSKKDLRCILTKLQGEGLISTSTLNWQEPQLEDFKTYFSLAQNWIREKKISKAVPVVSSTSRGKFSPANKVKTLLNLLDGNHLFAYFSWDSLGGVIGNTPEILFEGCNGEFSTMALAGTSAPDYNLLSDAKENKEHQIVVDYLIEALPGARVEETGVWNIGSLQHLRTNIHFPWAGRFEDLAAHLHPTPALGVHPKSEFKCLKFVCNEEQRFNFGAPFGAKIGSQWRCLVAIRNVIWRGEEIFLPSGCGIIEESELEKEWRELASKRNFSRQQLGL